jgi:tetratricopeptide (TPR) repeat protein
LLQLGELKAVEEMLPVQHQLLASVGYQDDPARFGLINVEACLWRCQGQLEKALQHLQTELRAMRARGDRSSLTEAGNLMAEIGLELGQWEMAEQALMEMREIIDPAFGEETQCLLVAVLAQQGRIAEARRTLAEARERVSEFPTPRDEERLALAEVHLMVAEARWPEALTTFALASRLQTKMEMRWHRAQTLREWAEAHLKRAEPGDMDRARELLREAQAEFEAMNVPKYAALVRERLAQIG